MCSFSLNLGATTMVLLKPPIHLRFTSPTPMAMPTLPHGRTISVSVHNWQGKAGKAICRAELSQDAPFIAAIGACMLTSLVLPVTATPDDDDDNKSVALDSDDARFAVMGIISFIPYFNWLSWVFAWLDTGKRRYAVYSLVYLAPYLRTNLSLSPEESWVPIASILLCVLHIQLEASIRNGDIQGFQLFSEARKSSSMTTKKHIKSNKNRKNLPSTQGKTQRWEEAKEPGKDLEPLENDWEDGEADRTRH